ncbi:DUF6069 family protein [Glycomyces harbinensis]|uniref:Uncharacterized protein n=1 Tax=Glycomyces harbinensis TaxID=58114 RepID=A0A1G6SXD4_9ACTN|nr:DUF6069 family protein [Glycomyces harbinensis]SDD20847.1 hypothetical protein SAMN05216270_102322 [Glycomyces harbinensis]
MSAPQGGWDRNYEEPTRPYPPVTEPKGAHRSAVDAGKLWAGGFGTAVVAALVALVGILLVRGVLGIHILSPSDAGAYGDATTTTYAFGAFAAAILATGMLHLLLLLMPRPMSFFNWIMLLVIAVGVLIPFTVVAELESQFATAALNFVIGICVMSLLNSVSGIATRAARGPAGGEGIGLP